MDDFTPTIESDDEEMSGHEIDKDSESCNSENKNELDVSSYLGAGLSKYQMILLDLYRSTECRYFYILFTALATAIVLWILIKGSEVQQSPLFIIIEIVINVCIAIDFCLKIYMNGLKNYLCSKQLTNIFDAIVATSCVILFFFMLFTSSTELIVFEEAVEDMFFILWCALQYLRIFMLIKYQKDVKEGAGKIIDIMHFHSDSFQRKSNDIFPIESEFNRVPQKEPAFVRRDEEKYDSPNRKANKLKIRRSYDDENICYSD